MSKVVLGGGVGGLSAAYYLRKKFPYDKISLIEASSRIGGWVKSNIYEDRLFEQGPRTLRPRGHKGANTLDLVEELGLQTEILPLSVNDAAVKNRMIYVNGSLHTLPSNLLSIFKTQSPFSKPLIYYLFKEMAKPRKLLTENDESIYSFAERRFGNEIADYVVSPLICGICAGNAREISVKFLMEHLFNYEQQYGSITEGLIYNMFKRTPKYNYTAHLNKCAEKDRWSIYTFRNGVETLPKRLDEVNRCNNVEVSLNSTCTAIEVDKDVTLYIGNNRIKTEHVIACIPANILSTVLKGHPKLSLLLQNIPYTTVGVVNLHYKSNVLEQEGFGFLIPPIERLPILGVTFDSCCIPCSNGTVLTVMMGGHWFNDYFGHNPNKEHLLDVAITQISNTMGIKQMPDAHLVNILRNCIPQYVIGHNNTVEEIKNYVKSHKLPLSLCGSSYYGVGINDVIWSSKTAVDNL